MNIVLVHGAFVDGSSWRAVYDLLTEDGHHVAVVQNPTLSLSGDAAATRLIIDAQDGPVVLVGHSYGGAVITEAGSHDKVTELVYIAAFAPDKGESVKALGGDPDAPGSPIVPAPGGFLFQDRAKFHTSFGADLPAAVATFMADAQVPWAADAMAGQVTEPAWRGKPSWYLVATEDRMIRRPPSAQWRSGLAPPTARWPQATPSTCHSRAPLPPSFDRPASSGSSGTRCASSRCPVTAASGPQDDSGGSTPVRTGANRL
ncbi:MAG: hypothetical protein QOD59_5780 [Mycobacterium sp.]|nr:hypothetical protein [Mycobacterium sp.]